MELTVITSTIVVLTSINILYKHVKSDFNRSYVVIVLVIQYILNIYLLHAIKEYNNTLDMILEQLKNIANEI